MIHKLADLLDLPIISLTTGSQIAVIKDFLLNSEQEQLQGLIGQDSTFIPWESIYSIGHNAVIVNLDQVEAKGTEDRESPMFIPEDIVGTTVITSSGKTIGEVKDIYVDGLTGKIRGFEISDGILKDLVAGRSQVSLPNVITFGEDVLVIQEAGKGEI